MQAADLQCRQFQCFLYEGKCLSCLHRNPEFYIDGTCGNCLKGMRIDARSNTQQDFLDDTLCRCLPGKLFQFFGVVYDEIADPVRYRILDIRVRLPVPVEEDFLRGKPRAEGGMDFSDGHRVNTHSLLCHNPVYLPKRCRLACVEGKRFLAEAFLEHAGIQSDIPTDAVFVHQI